MAAPPQAHLFCLSIRYDVPCPDMCVDPYSSLYTRAIQRNNQSQLKDTITFHILTHRRLNLDVVLFGDVGKLYIKVYFMDVRFVTIFFRAVLTMSYHLYIVFT